MGKAKIDVNEAVKLRIKGASLREIGKHFGTSGEAVRQAFERVEKRKKEAKKLTRLLAVAGIDEQGNPKSPPDVAKTLNDWSTIIEAAKKGIALESEVALLKNRISHLEESITTRKTSKKDING